MTKLLKIIILYLLFVSSYSLANEKKQNLQNIYTLLQEKKFKEGLNNLQILSEKNDIDAQLLYSKILFSGDLTPQDFEKSYFWGFSALLGGLKKSSNILEKLNEFLTEEQIRDITIKLIEFLEKSYVKKIDVEVHNASSVKSLKWYIKAFKAHPFARWKFAIDGLPKDSHKYRINQDGEKLFNVMKESVKYLKRKPQWQYIVFKYNQNDIDEASKMADSIGVDFYTLISSRWRGPNDPYKPTRRKYILDKGRGPLAFQKDYVL